MKNKTYIFSFFLWTILIAPFAAAQQKQDSTGEWLRVRGDGGEFSIEFPAAYEFIKDDEGFSVSNRQAQNYRLKQMRMLNAFYEKTLLGFEVYQTDSAKAVADVFADREENSGKRERIKTADRKFEQIVMEKKEFYAVRRFYHVGDYVYVLTAASRNGETEAMRRFLDSFRLKTDKTPTAAEEPAQSASVKTVSFAELKVLQLQIESVVEPPQTSADKDSVRPAAPDKDENSLPFVVLVKPAPSYTNAARRNSETGIVKLRLTFSPNGSVSKINLLAVLEDGLLRQSVFAALRLKFLPPEKNGKAVSTRRTLEYNFNIY